jgi:hypothetical protein
MSTATNAGELIALDALYRGASAISGHLGATHIALFTSNPGEAGGGTEANYGGYARAPVTWGAASSVAGVGTIANSAPVTFPTCTSGANTITHWGAFTAAVGGTMLAYGTCSLSVVVGTPPNFPTGALSPTAD